MVSLGASTLTVINKPDSTFGGVISGLGALIKGGQGTLELTNANIYSGGTLIRDGGMLVDNMVGSGTGIGPVRVKSGVLGGDGAIGGAVTVGTGSGKGAFLSPVKARTLLSLFYSTH